MIALIALVSIMLAAIALTRSVDTSTLVSGNLAFKQSATVSADNGLESAIAWLAKTSADNIDKDPFNAAHNHPFNTTNAAAGYYSSVDPGLSLTADSTWAAGASASAGTDKSGNTIRYVIQRMCRTANQPLSESECLFSDSENDTGSKRSKNATEAGAKTGGKIPLNRITVRVTGPKNTVSYVQAFVY